MKQDIPREATRHERGQEVWWNPGGWPAPVAFLVGIPVGFLYRPLQSPETLAGPVPLYFSFWGAWWVPVIVLGGLMWLKMAAVYFWQRKQRAPWPLIGAHLVWLAGLVTLVCGIAPTNLLPPLGLDGQSESVLSALLNPLAVGLAATCIFADVSGSSIPAGQGIGRALLAWLGTLICFLVLLVLYHLVVPQQPSQGRCLGFCSTDPSPYYLTTWFLWIPISLILATLGGFFGLMLCHVTETFFAPTAPTR